MGDRTWGELTVLDLDTEKYPDEAAAIIAVIGDAGLEYQWDCPDDVDPFTTLQVGHRYADDQVSCGFVYDHLVDLPEAAPHATFFGYETPKYEWLGDLLIHVPGLGSWWQTCGENGNPVFSIVEVQAIADAAAGRPGQRAASRRRVQALLAKAASTEHPDEAIALRAKARRLMDPVELALGLAWHDFVDPPTANPN